MQSLQPLWGWSRRGDLCWRDIGLLPSSSVSSSTCLAVMRPRPRPRPFPRGRFLPIFIGGTKWHFRDRTTEGQKGGTERTSGTKEPGQNV